MSDPTLTPGATIYAVDKYPPHTMIAATVTRTGPTLTFLADWSMAFGGRQLPTVEAVQRLTPEGAWSLFIGAYDERVRDAERRLRYAEEQRAAALNLREKVMAGAAKVTP